MIITPILPLIGQELGIGESRLGTLVSAYAIMVGVFALDVYKNRHAFDAGHISLVAIGFVVSFLSGLVVVKYMLDFVSKRGFGPFAWWRIAVGVAGLALMYTHHWPV